MSFDHHTVRSLVFGSFIMTLPNEKQENEPYQMIVCLAIRKAKD